MSWFKNTVDKIVARFDAVVADLEKHASNMQSEQQQYLSDLEYARGKANEAANEAERALKIAGKIRDLIEKGD